MMDDGSAVKHTRHTKAPLIHKQCLQLWSRSWHNLGVYFWYSELLAIRLLIHRSVFVTSKLTEVPVHFRSAQLYSNCTENYCGPTTTSKWGTHDRDWLCGRTTGSTRAVRRAHTWTTVRSESLASTEWRAATGRVCAGVVMISAQSEQ